MLMNALCVITGNVARLWGGRPKGNVQPRADKFFINSRYGKRSPPASQSTPTKGEKLCRISYYAISNYFYRSLRLQTKICVLNISIVPHAPKFKDTLGLFQSKTAFAFVAQIATKLWIKQACFSKYKAFCIFYDVVTCGWMKMTIFKFYSSESQLLNYETDFLQLDAIRV